jgi:DNA-binding response OmpR family regulator
VATKTAKFEPVASGRCRRPLLGIEKLDLLAGMNLGADDYITKPVAKADLLAAIRLRLERPIQHAVLQRKRSRSNRDRHGPPDSFRSRLKQKSAGVPLSGASG